MLSSEKIEIQVRNIISRNIIGADSFAIKSAIVPELVEFITSILGTTENPIFKRAFSLWSSGHSEAYIRMMLTDFSRNLWGVDLQPHQVEAKIDGIIDQVKKFSE